MHKAIAPTFVVGIRLAFNFTAWAFQCSTDFEAPNAAIARAMTANAKHNHEMPTASAHDLARAVAKARTAKGYAEDAEMMAKR